MGKFFKLAFGPKAMDTVLKLFKKRQVPKALSQKITGNSLAAIKPKKEINKLVANTPGGKKHLQELKEFEPYMGKTVGRDRGDILNQIQGSKGFKKKRALSGKDRKAIESVTKGHELDELAAKTKYHKGKLLTRSAHADDTVLLREHNRVTTLPEEYRSAKKYLRKFRKGTGESKLLKKEVIPKGMNFSYGKSPRLSRHAIKRINEASQAKQIAKIDKAQVVREKMRKLLSQKMDEQKKSRAKRLFGMRV